MLSHLVAALHLGSSVKYLTERTTPDWFTSNNDYYVQLRPEPDVVMERRHKDIRSGSRDRPLQLDQIIKHQLLCDAEWDRIAWGSVQPRKGMVVDDNLNLDSTVKRIQEVVYGE